MSKMESNKIVEVGRFTLESLTTGMYSDPKIVYREYFQNSVDSIENAVSAGIIKQEEAYIKIFIDAEMVQYLLLIMVQESQNFQQNLFS